MLFHFLFFINSFIQVQSLTQYLDTPQTCLHITIYDLFGDGWSKNNVLNLHATIDDTISSNSTISLSCLTPGVFGCLDVSNVANFATYTFTFDTFNDNEYSWEVLWSIQFVENNEFKNIFYGTSNTDMIISYDASTTTYELIESHNIIYDEWSTTIQEQTSDCKNVTISTYGSSSDGISETYIGASWVISDADTYTKVYSYNTNWGTDLEHGNSNNVCLSDGSYIFRVLGAQSSYDLATVEWSFCGEIGDQYNELRFDIKDGICTPIMLSTVEDICNYRNSPSSTSKPTYGATNTPIYQPSAVPTLTYNPSYSPSSYAPTSQMQNEELNICEFATACGLEDIWICDTNGYPLTPMCEFDYIECNSNGFIESIDLSTTGTTCTLPNINFKYLKYLDLSNVYIESVPLSLINSTELQTLKLKSSFTSDTRLFTYFPFAVGSSIISDIEYIVSYLPVLTILDISDNQLTGEVSSILCTNTIQELYMNGNRFTCVASCILNNDDIIITLDNDLSACISVLSTTNTANGLHTSSLIAIIICSIILFCVLTIFSIYYWNKNMKLEQDKSEKQYDLSELKSSQTKRHSLSFAYVKRQFSSGNWFADPMRETEDTNNKSQSVKHVASNDIDNDEYPFIESSEESQSKKAVVVQNDSLLDLTKGTDDDEKVNEFNEEKIEEKQNDQESDKESEKSNELSDEKSDDHLSDKSEEHIKSNIVISPGLARRKLDVSAYVESYGDVSASSSTGSGDDDLLSMDDVKISVGDENYSDSDSSGDEDDEDFGSNVVDSTIANPSEVNPSGTTTTTEHKSGQSREARRKIIIKRHSTANEHTL